MRRVTSRLIAALALVAAVVGTSAVAAEAAPSQTGTSQVARHYDGKPRTADWWF